MGCWCGRLGTGFGRGLLLCILLPGSLCRRLGLLGVGRVGVWLAFGGGREGDGEGERV